MGNFFFRNGVPYNETAGSEAGARRLAILYTVLLTCKLHKVNSFKYLSDVLKKLPARKEGDDIDDLLPMNWKEPVTAQD